MVIILIVLISTLLFLAFEGNLKELYAKITEKQSCKSSVQANALLKMRYADFSGEIKCPIVPLKINDKNDEIAKKKIADAMYDCWDQFGQGKLELFTDDNVYCTICHRITFDEDVKINGFSSYLATNYAPGQKISYLQFLTTEQTQNAEFLKEFENKKIEESIDASKNKEYAVIFTYIKGKKPLEEIAQKSKYATPGAGLAFLGAGLVFKVAPALATIPVIGIGAATVTVTAGTMAFGTGLLWSYLALNYAGVPFDHIALISLIPYDAQNLQNLNCREIPIKQS